MKGIFLFGMDWRVAFADYPATRYDAAIGGLHQAGTLGAEMTFYLLAPLLMYSWKIGAALLAASLGLRAYFVGELGTDLNDVELSLDRNDALLLHAEASGRTSGAPSCRTRRRHGVVGLQLRGHGIRRLLR